MELLEDLKVQLGTYYEKVIELLPKLGIALILIVLFLLTAKFFRTRAIKFLRTKADDPLLVNFINQVFRILNIVFAMLVFLYIIGQTGIATSILGAASISAIVIGFAFKDIGENFIAGVMMAFKRPFRVGDTVQTNGITGSIVGLSLRDTHMKTFDGKDVYIPNGQIVKNPLYNYTIDGFLRNEFTLGVDYDSDLPTVRKLIMDSLAVVPGILQETKIPKTLIKELGSSTVNITVQYWIDTFDKNFSGTEIQSQAMNSVLKRLDQAGINMPGDIIEVKNYNKEALNLGGQQKSDVA